MVNNEISKLCKDFANNVRNLLLKELDNQIATYQTDMVRQMVADDFKDTYKKITQHIKAIEREVKIMVE